MEKLSKLAQKSGELDDQGKIYSRLAHLRNSYKVQSSMLDGNSQNTGATNPLVQSSAEFGLAKFASENRIHRILGIKKAPDGLKSISESELCPVND